MAEEKEGEQKVAWAIRCWIAAAVIVLVLAYSWLAFHEVSHAVVCKSLGGNAYLKQIGPYPIISCEVVAERGKPLVLPSEYFVFTMIPYLLALLILLIIWVFQRHKSALVFAFAAIIFMDNFVNYAAAIKYNSDFRIIAAVDPYLFVPSAALTLAVLFFSYLVMEHNSPAFEDRCNILLALSANDQKQHTSTERHKHR